MRSRRDVDLLFDGIAEELNGFVGLLAEHLNGLEGYVTGRVRAGDITLPSEMTDREPNERIQRLDEQGAPVAESQARLPGS